MLLFQLPPQFIIFHISLMQSLLLLETTQLFAQLQRIKHEQLLIKKISQYLVRKSDSQPFCGKINIHAASAINWLINQQFQTSKEPNKEVKFEFWAQFREFILLNDKIPYKTLLILQKSLFIFIQTFEDKFQQIINELFSDLPYNSKVLFFQTIFDIRCEADNVGKIAFLKQNIQQYIGNVLIFISEAHNNMEIFSNLKYSQLEKDSLESLARAVQFLVLAGNNGNNQDIENIGEKENLQILGKLVMNQKLISIIQEVMTMSYKIQGSTNNYTIIKIDSIQYITTQGLPTIDKRINQYKAHALQIQCILLNQVFCGNAGPESFQTYRMLEVFEKQIPDVINFLINLKNSNRKLHLEQMIQNCQFSDILNALLQLLCSGLRFSYLRGIYLQRMKQVCFQIAHNFLMTSQAQKNFFEQSPIDFISISENLIQKVNTEYLINFDGDEQSTPKCKAGKLLELYVANIDEASLYLLGVSMDTIQYIASNNKIQSIQLKQLLEKYHYVPSLQISFIIFSIFSAKLSKQREDIAKRLRDFMINNLDFLRSISRVQFGRMCLMFAYNFLYIFPQNDPRILDVVNIIINRLDEDFKNSKVNCTETYCILQFLCQNIVHFGGVGQKLWFCLLQVSNVIQNSEILGKLYQVLRKVQYYNLPDDIVKNLSKNLFTKIFQAIEYELKINGQVLQQASKLKGAPKIYEYIKIIKSIVISTIPSLTNQDKIYLLAQRKSVAQGFQKFFQEIFPELNRIEFDEEIIQIYVNYLKAISSGSKIPQQCFNLVQYLKPLHGEILGYNRHLFKVYQILLEKGFDIYNSSEVKEAELEQIAKYHNNIQSKQNKITPIFPKNLLSWIIHNIQYIFSLSNINNEQLLFYSNCNILQYVFIFYGKTLQLSIHEHFNKILLAKYEKYQNGKQMKQWNLASLINTLAIGETIYPQVYKRSYLIVMDHSITIFKNYRAKMFSFALSRIIDQILEQNISWSQKLPLLIDHLKLGVRLIHFSRQLALALNDKEQKIRKNSPFYEELTSKSKYRQVDYFKKIDKFEQIKKIFMKCREKLQIQIFEDILKEIQKEIPKRQLYDLLNTVIMDEKPRMIFSVRVGSQK